MYFAPSFWTYAAAILRLSCTKFASIVCLFCTCNGGPCEGKSVSMPANTSEQRATHHVAGRLFMRFCPCAETLSKLFWDVSWTPEQLCNGWLQYVNVWARIFGCVWQCLHRIGRLDRKVKEKERERERWTRWKDREDTQGRMCGKMR